MMINDLTSWSQNAPIVRLHKLRIYSHLALLFVSIILLLSTSIVLAYSIKLYYGGFLHAIPELMSASCVALILLGLAWLPSDEYPGVYGVNCMRYVWQELAWSSVLTLGLFAGLVSLHESTPGLMFSCGRFFICRGYIFVFVSAWFSWLFIALPTGTLWAGVLYQLTRKINGQNIWELDVARFEYFWPAQTHLKTARRTTHPGSLPRVQPDPEQIKAEMFDFSYENEKPQPQSIFEHN